MKDRVKVKIGAITRDIPKGALKWYLAAKWQIVEEPKIEIKKVKDDKTNTKEITM